MITVDLALLALVSGSVIPLITGFLTKLDATSKLKAFVTVFLAVLVAVVSHFQKLQGVSSVKEAVFVGLTALIAAAGSYYGFLKPSGIAPTVQEKTAGFGIG